MGIWEATTNLCNNGGFESGTTGWVADSDWTLSRITTDAKFGSACLRAYDADFDGSASSFRSPPCTVSATTIYTASVWIRVKAATGVGGGRLKIWWYSDASGTTYISESSATVVGETNDQWVKISITATSPGTAASARVVVANDGYTSGNPVEFYVDGVQLEQQPLATPYHETNGATATRSSSRVQLPVTGLDETQGWIAIRLRSGFASTLSDTNHFLFTWGDSTSDRISLAHLNGASQFGMRRRSTASPGADVNISTSAWAAGDLKTIVMKWTAADMSLSVDGGVFSTSASTSVPALAATLADIGPGTLFTGTNQPDSDVFWFACGTGTLADADASAIHAAGNNPSAGVFGTSAALTLLWDANDSNYLDSFGKRKSALQLLGSG